MAVLHVRGRTRFVPCVAPGRRQSTAWGVFARQAIRFAVVVVSALGAMMASGGCLAADGVRVVGDVDGRPLRAVGTAVAWLDRTHFVEDADGAFVLERRAVGETSLHLRFFEAVFDPGVTFDRLPDGERTALEQSIASGDEVDVVVARGAALRAGDEVVAAAAGEEPEVLPYITAFDAQLREGVRADGTYPDDLPAPQVDLESVRLDIVSVQPRLQGELHFAMSGGGSVHVFVVGFQVALQPERTGECNFDRAGAGAVDACTLAPP